MLKFVKTKSSTLNLPCHVQDSKGEKEVTKDYKDILIIENYKNVHNGHSHGAS